MIVCPRCSHENEDSARNCANCRINLQWALENLCGEAPVGLPREVGLERAGRFVVPDPKAKWYHTDGGFKVVLLLLLGSTPLALALFYAWFRSTFGVDASGEYLVAAAIGLGTAVLWWSAVRRLRRSKPKPKVLRAVGLLILVPLILGGVGGVGYGLMQGMLVILPERSGRSLITQYDLGERDFSGVHLEQADLSGAALYWADLSEADLMGASLNEADLWKVNLSKANLMGASLNEADLWEANLSKADLSGATLREADLRGADLSGADLSGSDLSGADLTGATVTADQLAQARSLKGTILPDGSVHE